MYRIFVRGDIGTVLMVLEVSAEIAAKEENRVTNKDGTSGKRNRPSNDESMLRLSQNGIIVLPSAWMYAFYSAADYRSDKFDRLVSQATEVHVKAKRKHQASVLLEGEGFVEEAAKTALEAMLLGVNALATLGKVPEVDDNEFAVTFYLTGIRKKFKAMSGLARLGSRPGISSKPRSSRWSTHFLHLLPIKSPEPGAKKANSAIRRRRLIPLNWSSS